MLHKIKRKLIILNTVLTGIILSVVVIGAGYINLAQIKNNNRKDFAELRDTIVSKLQSETSISNSWMSKLEVKHNAIIHIEDNGVPFFFKGAWNPSTSRDIMINKAKKAARAEGIDTAVYTISSYKNSSSILDIRGNHKEAAYAVVCIIPDDNGYISLTLIQFRPHERVQTFVYLIAFTGIDLLGIFALFLVSCYFVGKVVKPAEESQKRQNEFIAAASHDLRSPLAVIQSNASALLMDEAQVKRFVPKIIEECTRMSRLIGDMLILASSDAKTWHIEKEEIDTESYLIERYDAFCTLCNKRKHSLFLDFPEEALPTINVDKGRFTQVLGILIDNAISYSPEESQITLRPYVKKSSFFIEVEDHGSGISREQKEKIFNRFYRADQSRNNTEHFGLGLSVAKELMELQNGKIYVKDTIGGGATFVLELPL